MTKEKATETPEEQEAAQTTPATLAGQESAPSELPVKAERPAKAADVLADALERLVDSLRMHSMLYELRYGRPLTSVEKADVLNRAMEVLRVYRGR